MPAAVACRADAGPSALPGPVDGSQHTQSAPGCSTESRSQRAQAAVPPPACVTCVLSHSRYAPSACEKITSRSLATGMQRMQHALA